MKNLVITTSFLTTIVFMLIAYVPNCGAAQRKPFHGACSSDLMNTLHVVCGSRGITNMKARFFWERYGRRYRSRHGRGKRAVGEEKIYSFGQKFTSFSSEYNLQSKNYSPLRSIIETGNSINEARETHNRVRRQLSTDCCENDCSIKRLRRRYCNFKGR